MFFPTLSGGMRMAGSDTLTVLECHDIRFPASDRLDGSDAMNPDPDHSAAYVALRTTGGSQGHGRCFTIGRGNEVMTAAIRSLAPHLTGRPAPATAADPAALHHDLSHDSQLRWLGPEKGVMRWRPARWSTRPGTWPPAGPDRRCGSSWPP